MIPEHRFKSKYSGEMDIRWEGGRLALNSPEANYSFNRLHKIFLKAFSSLDLHLLGDNAILNLGMGAGSTISILRDELKLTNRIISVEFDPTIIEMAKQYFNIASYSDHHIFEADASSYVQKCRDEYGLVIIDLFVDKLVSGEFLTHRFFQNLDALLVEDGQVMFNYIGEDVHPISGFIPDHYPSELVRIDQNQVLIYRKTERS